MKDPAASNASDDPNVVFRASEASSENLRCYGCGCTDVVYRVAKVYCAKCGRLIENCCGD